MFPLSLSLSLSQFLLLKGPLVFLRDEVSSSSATSFPRDEKDTDHGNATGYWVLLYLGCLGMVLSISVWDRV